MRLSLYVLTCVLLAACARDTDPAPVADLPTSSIALPTFPPGSRLPRFGTGNGRLLLSYVISDTVAGDRLFVREYREGGWGPDSLLAAGTDWFVNWADFPSVRPLGRGLFYHYLAYSGAGTYDYNIEYSVGAARPQVLHSDGISAEHGFLSAAPLNDGSLQVSWLDGRNTGRSAGDHDHHGGSGAMSLRTARVDSAGGVYDRTGLDGRVCDCCNTATVSTGAFTMVAYRDRSAAEVRDIAFTLRAEGEVSWTTPRVVYPDDWEITGCPVNGPALAANPQGEVAVAWYTAAAGIPRVQFARYRPDSAAFGQPVIVDDRDPLGRVDLVLAEDGTAYLLGLAATLSADTAALTLYTVAADGGVRQRELARVPASRSTGFPRIALFGGELWYAFTRVGALGIRVEVGRL